MAVCKNPVYSDHKVLCAGSTCWSGIEKAAWIHKLQLCSTWFILPESFAVSVLYFPTEEAGISVRQWIQDIKSNLDLWGEVGCEGCVHRIILMGRWFEQRTQNSLAVLLSVLFVSRSLPLCKISRFKGKKNNSFSVLFKQLWSLKNTSPGELLCPPEQWEVRSHQAADSLPQATEGMAADQGDGRAMATSDLSWNTDPLVIANLNYNTDNTLKSEISDLSICL